MKNGRIRDEQLAQLVTEEFDLILASAADSRLGALQVTQVACTPGGGHFTIFVEPNDAEGAFNDLAELRALLDQAVGYLRSELASALHVKRSPQISLVVDPVYVLARWGR